MCACVRACVYIYVYVYVCTRAYISLSVFLQRGRGWWWWWLSLAVLRLTPGHLRIRLCPAHVPDRLPSNPLSVRWCVQRGGTRRRRRRRRRHTRDERGRGRALDRGMDATGCREMRVVYTHDSLSLALSLSSLLSFVSLYRFSRSSVHASRRGHVLLPSLPPSVIWTLRRVIRNCMSST